MKNRRKLVLNAVVNVVVNLVFCFSFYPFTITNPLGIFVGLLVSAGHVVSLYFVEKYFLEKQWCRAEKFCETSTLPSVIVGCIIFALISVLNEMKVTDGYSGLAWSFVCLAYLHHCIDILIAMCIVQRFIKKQSN